MKSTSKKVTRSKHRLNPFKLTPVQRVLYDLSIKTKDCYLVAYVDPAGVETIRLKDKGHNPIRNLKSHVFHRAYNKGAFRKEGNTFYPVISKL